MKISVILAHPNKESFNHAVAKASVEILFTNKHDVSFHDLHEEKFDAILPPDEIPKDVPLPPEIEKHCNEIAEADGIIIIHPNWWGMPPAIMKGWIDGVIRPGIAYKFLDDDKGEGVPVGLLKAKSAIVFNTSNTKDEREKKVFGDPLETLWKNCIFNLCGVTNVYRRTFNIIVMSTEEERKEWLRKTKLIVNKYFPKNC
jgi:putative NADPH-quinone reductase